LPHLWLFRVGGAKPRLSGGRKDTKGCLKELRCSDVAASPVVPAGRARYRTVSQNPENLTNRVIAAVVYRGRLGTVVVVLVTGEGGAGAPSVRVRVGVPIVACLCWNNCRVGFDKDENLFLPQVDKDQFVFLQHVPVPQGQTTPGRCPPASYGAPLNSQREGVYSLATHQPCIDSLRKR
jgi:hypothetical protein